MVPPRPDEIRRTLAERVARRVQGHGVTRASVDAAVDKVLGALAATGASASASTVAASSGQPTAVAALSGRSVPDLASRVRAALEREGVPVGALGSATAGSHNVVTLEVNSSSRAALERVAGALELSLSFVPATAAR